MEKTFDTGFIYVIEAVETGLVKIGWTAMDPVKRMAALQVGSPVQLKLRGVINGTPDDESKLHDDFAALHSHGEWFRLSGPVADFIATILGNESTVDALPKDVRVKVELCQESGKPVRLYKAESKFDVEDYRKVTTYHSERSNYHAHMAKGYSDRCHARFKVNLLFSSQ